MNRLVLAMFAGDYRDAYRRMDAGIGETYYGHDYAVKELIEISKSVDELVVIHCYGEKIYDETLIGNLRVISTGLKYGDSDQLMNVVGSLSPDKMILHLVDYELYKWAANNKINSLVILADSFKLGGIKNSLRNIKYSRMLNKSNFQIVSNHGVAASENLVKIGVNKDKVIAWDWPYEKNPYDYEPKVLDVESRKKIFYAGKILENKGVFDLVNALAILNEAGENISLKLAGVGEIEMCEKIIAGHKELSGKVELLGMQTNEQVFQHMLDSTIVVVPSRHSYPEGFPLTIYEALCARTPLVVSDHPMFAKALTDGANSIKFPAQDVKQLASALKKLSCDQDLYSKISENSLETWQSLQIDLKWGQLIKNWLTYGNISSD